LYQDRAGFLARLRADIAREKRKAKRLGLPLAVRLNVTSDLDWVGLAPDLFDDNPEVIFYDYTKILDRAIAAAQGKMPKNYRLHFSHDGHTDQRLIEAYRAGVSVVVVVKGWRKDQSVSDLRLPNGLHYIDGDEHDERFRDPANSVVLLREKGGKTGLSISPEVARELFARLRTPARAARSTGHKTRSAHRARR